MTLANEQGSYLRMTHVSPLGQVLTSRVTSVPPVNGPTSGSTEKTATLQSFVGATVSTTMSAAKRENIGAAEIVNALRMAVMMICKTGQDCSDITCHCIWQLDIPQEPLLGKRACLQMLRHPTLTAELETHPQGCWAAHKRHCTAPPALSAPSSS